MTRRTRRADLLPPPDFTSRNSHLRSGLTFTAVNEDGTERLVVTLEKLPGAERLRSDLLAGMIELNGPRGRWRSIYTVQTGYQLISSFLRWLDTNGYEPKSVADVDVAIWNSWVLHHGGSMTPGGSIAVRVVRAVLTHAPGRSQALVEAMARRVWSPSTPLRESYDEATYRRIRRLARKTVHTAAQRISANYELLLDHRKGLGLRPDAQARADALIEVFETGDVSTTKSYQALDAYVGKRRQLRLLQRSLFLTPQEAWAAAVLLATDAGWNSSVIHRLVLPDNSVGAGEDARVYTVTLYKPRRGVQQYSTTTVLSTSDVGRALTWIISATEPARAVLQHQGNPTDRLIVYGNRTNYSPQARFRFGVPKQLRESQKEALPPELYEVSLQKLRRTRQVLFDRTPTQNSRKTHLDTYVRNDRATHERARDVIETGLNDALSHAETVVKLRILAEDQVDDDIRSGNSDTVVAACTDYEHHPATGDRCTESFLACLGCSNAIATPRHLTRLTLLHEALLELSSALDPTEWRERWETHFLRLNRLFESHTSEAERNTARASATGADREIITRLLAGGFTAE